MKRLDGTFIEKVSALEPGMVGLLGIPFDAYSSYMPGPAQAPAEIRKAMECGSSNMSTEDIHDLGDEPRFTDLGDLEVERYLDDIEPAVTAVLERGAGVLALGGDHSVTYPVLRAYGKKFENLTVLHLDAHPDLYKEYDGNPYSNACPFARALEEGLVKRLVQVGVRTMNPHQLEQAQRYGVETFLMKNWDPSVKLALEAPLYISLDLDVLDPAYAPGVSHYEPGGMSVREVLRIIHGLGAPVVGADIVEYNPRRDFNGMTAMTAVKFLKEIADKML